ncbi:Dyp-type peroxidase [Staphylococcus aureus]|nr:Dyp-type peroxidase [Staphylococcus aureus]
MQFRCVRFEVKRSEMQLRQCLKSGRLWLNRMMDGDTVGKPSNNPLMPPVDTGESIGLGASKLTITFGISKSLMKKIGLSSKFPMPLKIYRIFRMIS